MRVYIWDFTHDRYFPVLTSENATVQRLLSQVVPQIVKERGPGRQVVTYLQKTGQQLIFIPQQGYRKKGGGSAPSTLPPWQTLSSAGVTENEVLILCYFIQPGAATADLQKRLAEEYEWLKELASKSEIIRVEVIEGTPPKRYRVTFKCRGVMLHPTNKKPCLSANHVMEIYLPTGIPGYPNEAPYVRCLTSHFHPNISQENNMVCLGIERDWESSLNIAWLVTHLADMITYRVYGIEKPYNAEAAKWAEDNKEKLPVDDRPPFKEEALPVASGTEAAEDVAISFEEPIEVAKAAAAEKKHSQRRPH